MCKLQKSIYGLKQASRSWNIKFDQSVKSFGFIQCPDEPCVYKRRSENVVVFLILYVDDILLIGNDVGTLSSVKVWLSNQFDMKDLGEASHILGIKLMRDRQKRMLGLYLRHPISIKFCPSIACKIPRRDLFPSELENLYRAVSVPRLALK